MIKFCLIAGITMLIISAVMLIFRSKVPKEYNEFYEDIMSIIGTIGTLLFLCFLLCVFG